MNYIIPHKIMKNNLLFTSVTLLIIMFSFSCTGEKNKTYPADIEEKIKQVENNLGGWVLIEGDEPGNLAERMRQNNVKGLCIAVVNDYKIEWVRGYGWADEAEQRPVTASTLFQAASISKSLNGVGIMLLVQEKKIDLHTDINEYLKTWKFPYDSISGNKPVTVGALLSHTAGLTIHGFPGYEQGDTLPTLPEILDGIKPANTEAVRSMTAPDTFAIYSGGGVTISQLIATDVTNEPYDLFMQEKVLDPMGMSSSFYTQPPPASKKRLLATGYKVDGSEVAGKYHIYPEQAAAGLWTNPEDLCRYIIETQLSWEGKSSKILTPEFTRLRLTPVIDEAAYGVFVSKKEGATYFSHGGGNEGFTCLYTGDLEKGNGFAIMTNSDNGSLLEEIANSIATVYGWTGYYNPKIKSVVEVPEPVLNSYTGKYEVEGQVVNIKLDNGSLWLNAFGNLYWKMYFTSDTEAFMKEYRAGLVFVTDADGKVTGLKADGMMIPKVE